MTAAAPTHREPPEPYDFRRPRLLSQDRQRTLHAVHETFGRRLAVFLSAQLRTLVELSVAAVEQRTYAAFVAESTPPSALFVASDRRLDERVVLEIAPPLVLFVAERLFGGGGAFVDEARPLSQIEQRVAHRLAARAFADLGASWDETAPLALENVGYEADVQFVQLLPDDAPVVVVGFEACVRGECAPLTLCYPFALVQHLLGAASTKEPVTAPADEAPPPVRAQYEETVGATTIELRAELGRTRLALGDLLGLAVGDVIPLQRRPSEPLAVFVGQQQRFRATAGRSGSRCALQITEVSDPIDPTPSPTDDA